MQKQAENNSYAEKQYISAFYYINTNIFSIFLLGNVKTKVITFFYRLKTDLNNLLQILFFGKLFSDIRLIKVELKNIEQFATL